MAKSDLRLDLCLFLLAAWSFSMAWPLHRAMAADVTISASTTSGIDLDAASGATASVGAGVAVTNNSFTAICSSFSAICASSRSWTITNNGTVGLSGLLGDAVQLKAGGAVINHGTIDTGASGTNGVWIEGGTSGSVDNTAGATINGTYGGVVSKNFGPAVTVTNAGIISSDTGGAVNLGGGGSVTNLATGQMIANSTGNAVTVILGTSRSVTNYGLIRNDGVGPFSTGVQMGGGASVLSNMAGATIQSKYNSVYVSGSGGTLTLDNAGTIRSTAGASVELGGGGSVTNSGLVESANADGVKFGGAGTITNRGTIRTSGGTHAINFTGNLAHTLVLDTGSVLGGNVQGGTGIDGLELTGSGAEAISKFIGFETLRMYGTNWQLTGTGTFATSGRVEAGVLSIDGHLSVPALTVDPGATLAGSGTVTGAVTVQGTLAPGGAPGNLAIAGPLTMTAGATYRVEISQANADRTDVTSAAVLAGTLKLVGLGGPYNTSTRYTILHSNAGVSGGFGTIDNSGMGAYRGTLSYDVNNVYLDLATSLLGPILDGGTSVNARSVVAGIDRAVDGGADLSSVNALYAMTGAPLNRALESLSGDIHTEVTPLLFDSARRFHGVMRDHGGAARSILPTGEMLWMSGYGARRATEADPAIGTEARLGQQTHVAIGAERSFGDGISAGWAVSAGGGMVQSGTSELQADIFQFGLYGTKIFDRMRLSTSASYGLANVTTDRAVPFLGQSDIRSNHVAHVLNAEIEASFDLFNEGGLRIAPLASMALSGRFSPGYRETRQGGGAGLAIDPSSDANLRSTVGIEFEKRLTLQDRPARIFARAGLAYDTRDAFAVGARAQEIPALAFTTEGARRGHIGVPVSAGFDYDIGPSARLTAEANAEFSGRERDYGVFGRVSLRF